MLEGGRMLQKIVGGLIIAVALSALARATSVAQSSPFKPDTSRPVVTQAEYDRWQKEISNWGRWGKDDEMGALNLITPAKRRAAAALVKEGLTVSLASNAATQKDLDVPCPAEWMMVTATQGGATDRIAYPCIHGAGATHIDSFAHIFFNGLAWNGYPVDTVVSKEKGAIRNSVLNMKNGIVTRAVLFDLPRLKGLPYLEPGTRVFPADLEAWEKKAGVKVGAGDALLFRWGRWARRAKLGTWAIDEGAAGFDNSVIPWLKQRDVSLIVWETPGYVPQPPGDLPRLALHNFALTMLGIMLIDRADLEAVGEAAAARNRWEFMLSVAPLPIPYGTGSPVNPLAMF
jgi:kynurenine formamidase